MVAMVVIRTLFMTCVPLFLLITGYLLSTKELSKSYYKGIFRIIIPYFLITVVTAFAKIHLQKYGLFEDENIKFSWFINGLLGYDLVGYAWYVEMYLGLFLLIPFLNKILNTEKISQKGNKIFVLTLIALTVLPSFCQKHMIVISYWQKIWPLTYYFIGAYIRKYNVTVKHNGLLLIVFLILFAAINSVKTYGDPFFVANMDAWCGFENITTSTLLFLLLINKDIKIKNKFIENSITTVAKLSLYIYLFSYLSDKIIYNYFNKMITNTADKLEWFIVVVPLSFLCSLMMSLFVKAIENTTKYFVNKIKIG